MDGVSCAKCFVRKFVYKQIGDVVLRLHVFAPAGNAASGCRPGIVFFFGGGKGLLPSMS